MKSDNQNKAGRPKSENPASERLPVVRVTPEQLKTYKETAEKSDITFSAWVRGVLDKAVKP